MIPTATALSVVICAYTEDRWADLQAAVASVRDQETPPGEIVVVIDHHDDLLARARAELAGAVVVPNAEARGLSGARNTGIATSTGAIIAFLDDDATAAPDWIAYLLGPYGDPDVLAVGGRVVPRWDEARPPWLPEELDWVVGCTYAGHRADAGPVRNLIGANMSVRRDVVDAVGGFSHTLGRTAELPAGCEETELFIRATQRYQRGIVWYEPAAIVSHRVPAARTTRRYFRARCYAEGISKTYVSRLVGSRDGLASERAYTTRTLPRALVRELRGAARARDRAGLARAATLVAGVAATGAGFAGGRLPRRTRSASPAGPGFVPARVVEIDLTEEIVDLTAAHPERETTYGRAVVLARRAGAPVGILDLALDAGGLAADELSAALENAFGATPITGPRSRAAGGAGRPATAPVTVVVATRDRVASLERCLTSLQALDPAPVRIVVVDNCPSDDAAAGLVRSRGADDSRLRYVREDRPGLARAHNRGLTEVDTDLVAFTDDDVVVDREWVGRLADAFARDPAIGCVTGMILPLELETPAQGWLERYAGFNKGFATEVYDLGRADTSALFPYAAGTFGSGANMAFRTDALRAIRGFDPALGAGTTAKGGDDLAAFFDVIVAGYALAYEPAAIVHHQHHRTFAALEAQTFGYGAGLTAYLTKTVLDHPARTRDMLVRLPHAFRHALSPSSAKNERLPADTPRTLVRRERLGMLVGPALYLRSRWEARTDTRPAPRPGPRPDGLPRVVLLPDTVRPGEDAVAPGVPVMHGRRGVGG